MLPMSRQLSGEDREEKLLPDADLATMTEETLGIVYRLTTPRKKIRSCTRHVMIVCADPPPVTELLSAPISSFRSGFHKV